MSALSFLRLLAHVFAAVGIFVRIEDNQIYTTFTRCRRFVLFEGTTTVGLIAGESRLRLLVNLNTELNTFYSWAM